MIYFARHIIYNKSYKNFKKQILISEKQKTDIYQTNSFLIK